MRHGQKAQGGVRAKTGYDQSHERLRNHGQRDQIEKSNRRKNQPLGRSLPLQPIGEAGVECEDEDQPAEEPQKPEVVKKRHGKDRRRHRFEELGRFLFYLVGFFSTFASRRLFEESGDFNAAVLNLSFIKLNLQQARQISSQFPVHLQSRPRRIAVVVLCLGICSVLKQQFGDFHSSQESGRVQGRSAILGAAIDRSPVLQQPIGGFKLADQRGPY